MLLTETSSPVKFSTNLVLNTRELNFISRVSQAPSLDEKVNLHFIAFVNVGGQLYELGELTTAEECLYPQNILS